jgi:hypothetical protein
LIEIIYRYHSLLAQNQSYGTPNKERQKEVFLEHVRREVPGIFIEMGWDTRRGWLRLVGDQDFGRDEQSDDRRAFCRPERMTLVGSIMPAFIMST